METSFKINTDLLFPAIKKIVKLVPSLKKAGNIKISVQPLDIVFSCPGIEFILPAETSGYADVMVPFIILYAIQKTEKAKSLTFTFSQGTIKTETITINNPRILVHNLFTKKAVDLPLNSNALDILRLRLTHTNDQLIEYNMLESVEKAEQKFEDELSIVIQTLHKYGISRTDILELIYKKLE